MTAHTPEPWRTLHGMVIWQKSDGPVAITGCELHVAADAYKQEHNMANAARIVACVNSCAGINPEAIQRWRSIIDQIARGVICAPHAVSVLVNLQMQAREAIALAKEE